MKNSVSALFLCLLSLAVAGCGGDNSAPESAMIEAAAAGDYPRGPNGGRLLQDGDFALELAIFETGVPPEYRAWGYHNESLVSPASVNLNVTLTRLGDTQDRIGFRAEGDYLRGDTVIYEPHSFIVSIEAGHQGQTHRWEFESFEGRTTISPAMAAAFGIETEVAGPATLRQTLKVIGTVKARPESSRHISARFDGPIQAVHVTVGQRVTEGQRLLTVESNASLQPYTIESPIAGTVVARQANPGEQTNGRVLLEIMNTSQVWAELSIHPSQRATVQTGMPVVISSPISTQTVSGTIDSFDLSVRPDQSIVARALIDNADNAFAPGTFIQGEIQTGEFTVPLAVQRIGLQPFRDFTVVYARIGDTYEVRMLELGRQDDQRVEVLGGLEPGTVYVTANSYILKADVEKSGASHDH